MTVTDTGVPQLTSTAQVFVNVININDNPPHFNESEYQLNVNENAMRGTSIGFVHAQDADEGNYEWFYYLKCFSIVCPPSAIALYIHVTIPIFWVHNFSITFPSSFLCHAMMMSRELENELTNFIPSHMLLIAYSHSAFS